MKYMFYFFAIALTACTSKTVISEKISTYDKRTIASEFKSDDVECIQSVSAPDCRWANKEHTSRQCSINIRVKTSSQQYDIRTLSASASSNLKCVTCTFFDVIFYAADELSLRGEALTNLKNKAKTLDVVPKCENFIEPKISSDSAGNY